jgi:hypothetical protein
MGRRANSRCSWDGSDALRRYGRCHGSKQQKRIFVKKKSLSCLALLRPLLEYFTTGKYSGRLGYHVARHMLSAPAMPPCPSPLNCPETERGGRGGGRAGESEGRRDRE